MHEIDLANLDLNLLVVLDVLLQERNVTRAAKRLHRTQPAISHALARLREQMGDPLLVKVGAEMRPTPKAERLAGEVSRVLRTLKRVLAQEGGFDPASSDRVFTLAGPDFVAAALPPLLERMARRAPHAGVELIPTASNPLRDVVNGHTDLAIMPTTQPAEGVHRELLAELDWVVYARQDHPAVSSWGLGAWASYPHIRVRTPSNHASPVDVAARAVGLSRPVGPILPHFLLGPALLARTDLLMTVPRAALADVAARFGLVALPCPVRLDPILVSLCWSAQLDQDTALAWFRGVVREAALEALTSPSPAPSRRRPASAP